VYLCCTVGFLARQRHLIFEVTILMQYNLMQLWPKFDLILKGDISSPDGLSALFVLGLFLLFIIFVAISFFNFWRANTHLKFYRSLISGLTAEKLLEKRREIVNKALSDREHGHLWREFDESLVHIPQKDRLCNTLDAAHFFNTQTISRGLTENRLLSAVPSFLTAIGVIGTFAGLQMGLAGLDVTSSDTDELKRGIGGLIGGASIAFMTSVWGVLSSVIFNFFEKALERRIRFSITDFQNEVDYLYPRITAEQSLTNIEDFSRQSTEKLAELDEKIGHKMQEAMQQASIVIRDGMEQSLNTILGPAIEKLVGNAQSGSEKALEAMLDRFLDGVGSAGDSQKIMMESAATQIAKASDGMSAGLNDFAASMDQQITFMADKNATILQEVESTLKDQISQQNIAENRRQEALTQGMDGFVSDLKVQLQEISNQNKSIMQDVSSALTAQIDSQREQDLARNETLDGQLTKFQGSQAEISKSIEAVIQTQQQQNVALFDGLEQLLKRMSELTQGQQFVTEGMQQASSDMKASSNQLGLLSLNVKSAADTMSEKLYEAVETSALVSSQNTESVSILQALTDRINTINESLGTAAVTMNSAAEKAETGLSSVGHHFNELAASLNSHIKDLEAQIAQLLNDYSTRVQDQTGNRLNAWNEHTNAYVASMTNAVQVLNGVVDEIDGKLGGNQR
jgi:hypothetical protein